MKPFGGYRMPLQSCVNTINEYIEGELLETTTVRKNRIVQTEGKRSVNREGSFYKLIDFKQP